MVSVQADKILRYFVYIGYNGYSIFFITVMSADNVGDMLTRYADIDVAVGVADNIVRHHEDAKITKKLPVDCFL